MKRKQKPNADAYTPEDRRRFQFRTTAEMRTINDRADARMRNDVQREESTDPAQAETQSADQIFPIG